MMGTDGFDNDPNRDDGVPHDYTQGSIIITPMTGRINITDVDIVQAHNFRRTKGKIGSTTIKVVLGGEITSGTISTNIPKVVVEPAKPVVPEEPAKLLWDPIARLIMSPTRYREEWLRHISDMNHERHVCLKRGDIFGARLAVIRAHFYALPVT
jgi:hypothetical protein